MPDSEDEQPVIQTTAQRETAPDSVDNCQDFGGSEEAAKISLTIPNEQPERNEALNLRDNAVNRTGASTEKNANT